MRLTAVILLGICLQASASGLSQSITFSGKEVPLETVFNVIKKQTGYVVSYKINQLRFSKPVNITASHLLLDDFLRAVLEGQPFSFLIKGRTIFIQTSQELIRNTYDHHLSIFLQPIKISGKVLAINQQPIEGATVHVKGKTISAVTNSSGYFEIEIDTGGTLVISHIGFLQKEIKVNAEEFLIVVLTQNNDALDTAEILVNTGYQKIKPNEINGSVVVITNKTLNQQTGTNILNRLDGVTSGLVLISVKQAVAMAPNHLLIFPYGD